MAKDKAKLIDFDSFKQTHREFCDMAEWVNSVKNLAIVWSWGASQWKRMNSHCLRFRVHGHKHRGHVYLAVNGSDLFDIVFTTSRGTIVQTIADVFVSDLVDTIDEVVERQPEYKF